MIQNHAFDNSIPVLTEVFTDEPAPLPAEVAAPQRPLDEALDIALESRAIDNWTEPEWNLLERRLTQRILQQLQGRVDFVLEQRLRDSMEEVLTHAIAGLTSELRTGLQATIEKIVIRAVAQEVAHLQALQT